MGMGRGLLWVMTMPVIARSGAGAARQQEAYSCEPRTGADGLDGGNRLHRARRAQQVPNHALGGVDPVAGGVAWGG